MSPAIPICTVLFLTILQISQVQSVFLLYGKKTDINPNESYTISFDDLDIKFSGTDKYWRPPSGVNIPYKKNISSNYTVDWRCENGLPLSMAIYQYSPYVSDKMEVKSGPSRKIIFNGTEKVVRGPTQYSFVFYGVFPAILKKALPTCCHNNSDVRFAKIIFEQYVPIAVDAANDYDFSFPLYGESMDDTMYKSNRFIPIIQAPSVALLVYSDDDLEGKTHFIATTIFKAWPMFIFIILISSSAGIVMRFLDHSIIEDRSSDQFTLRAWEGFWWAFVTMTTVGYGDRIPKSYLGRFFCMLWIIFGIVIISTFYGVITAALSASTKINFNIHGAKIGAVAGSKEYIFGLSLNADMLEFPSNIVAFTELHYHKRLSGMLVDNYVASSFGKQLEQNHVRVDRMLDHAITYGIRMAKGSERLEKCMRKYLRDNNQEVFELFRKSLNPVKNSKDRENLQKKEALKLFYQDDIMKSMMKYGAYFVACLLFVGVTGQIILYCYRRPARPSVTTKLVKDVNMMRWELDSLREVDKPVKDLLNQYRCFQHNWLKKMKAIHQE